MFPAPMNASSSPYGLNVGWYSLPRSVVTRVMPEPSTFTTNRSFDLMTLDPRRSLVKAMRFFGERMKIVVEPTGCLGAAAALDNVVDVRGRRVGVILSGGNIDLARYAELVAPAR